jgi:nucleotide-binding universal stress UspA family protein
MIFRHVLAPIDFDDTSGRALEAATDLAQTFGASLTILHTVEVPAYAYGNFCAGLPSPDVLGVLEVSARRALDEKFRTVRARVPASKAVLTVGVPWRDILSAIAREGADVVVIGTQRQRWLEHALLGSVAEKVVRTSPVPVLSIPPPPSKPQGAS